MLTDLLIAVVKALVDFVIGLRPEFEVHMPEGVITAFQFMRGFDSLMPVSETITVLGLFAVYIAATAGFKWLIKLIDWIADVTP